MNTKTKLRRAQDFTKFETIYNKLDEIYLKEFAKTASKKNKRLWICFFLALIAILSLCITLVQVVTAMTSMIDWKYIVIAILTILAFFIVMCLATPEEKKFKNNFKERIIGTLIKQMHPNLNYYPIVQDAKDVLTNYKMMGFEPSNYGAEYIDDEINGVIYDDINIRMCNISVSKSNGKNNTVIFNGLFAEMELDKNIEADIRILLPTTNYLGNANNCEKVQMDNSDFEKQFNVYTDNKIITNQILTSDIMERLKNYYEKLGMEFEVVIKNGKLCVRIETGSLFESIVIKNTLHKEDTFIYYSILNFAFDLLKDVYDIVENADI